MNLLALIAPKQSQPDFFYLI